MAHVVEAVERGAWSPDWATHPGEHVAEYLDINNWTAADLAQATGLPTAQINAILCGASPVTAESAARFEQVFGMKAAVWINLQAQWDAVQTRIGKAAAA